MKKLLYVSALILAFVLGSTMTGTYAIPAQGSETGTVTIQSGTFDAKLYWSTDLTNWQEAEGHSIFTSANWEPNHTQVRYLKVVNNGDFDFTYTVAFQSVNPLKSFNPLAQVMDVYAGTAPATPFTTLSELTAATPYCGTLHNGTLYSGTLAKGQSQILVLALNMQSSAGNEYQNETLGQFTVTLKAEQVHTHTVN